MALFMSVCVFLSLVLAHLFLTMVAMLLVMLVLFLLRIASCIATTSSAGLAILHMGGRL